MKKRLKTIIYPILNYKKKNAYLFIEYKEA